ncbi:uncharacterized protein C14orf119 [Euwallacea fornicatus]|uniref:uncharacterized protein C14orf119 n=1 Tax=Euwallacea fornicatus TaxID=995702 RepID=UPI0033902A2D
MTAINSNAQLRYLLEWFDEWSELQKSDFLLILAENYAHKSYVNGIVSSISNMNCREKPMSLFECRIKLFREWYSQWNIEMKENFLKKLGEIDPDFMQNLNAEIEEKDSQANNGINCVDDNSHNDNPLPE